MILRQFASNQPFLLATAPLVVLAMLLPAAWGAGLPLAPTAYPADELLAPLYTSKVAVLAMAVMLVVSGAVLSNFIFNRHEFFNVPSYVIGVLYALAGSSLCLVECSLPALLSALFVLMGLNKQMQVFKQSRVLSEFFQCGFWYGMAAVFYPPMITLAVGMWLMVLFMRAFHWREHLLPLLAFCVPFVYWIVWKYWNDELGELVLFNRMSTFDHAGRQGIAAMVLLIGGAVAFVMALPRYLFLGDRSSNKARGVKNVLSIMAASMVAAAVLGFLVTRQWEFSACLIPFAFVVGYWFTNYRYSLMAPFVFYMFFGVVVWHTLVHYGVL